MSRVTVSEGLFLLLVFSLPVMQPVYLDYRGYAIPPTDFVFLAAASTAALSMIRGGVSLRRSPMLWALGLYGAALCASTAASADRAHSSLKLLGDLYLIGLAVLTLLHVRSLDGLHRTLIAWLIGAAVTTVAAFAGLLLFGAGVSDPNVNLFLSIHGSLPDGGYPRVMAWFLNPNAYCAYMVASLAILITSEQVGWVRRGALSFEAAMIVAAAFSLSPGLGGLLLVLAFGAWCRWRHSRPGLVRLAIGVSAAGALLFLAVTTAVPAPDAPLSFSHLRPSSRMLTWIGSLRTFLAHPWLGKGLGLGVVEIGYTNPSGVYEWLTDAHNTWLSVLAQQGLVGFIAFVSIIAVLFRGAGLSMTSQTRVLRSGLTVAFATGFLYQSLSGSFENTRHVWVLIGLLAAAKDLPE